MHGLHGLHGLHVLHVLRMTIKVDELLVMQVCEFVLDQYQKNGLRFHFGTSPTKIEKTDSGVRVLADKCARPLSPLFLCLPPFPSLPVRSPYLPSSA